MIDPTSLIDIEHDDYTHYYEHERGIDVAHLSRHWYERERELYYVFSQHDLRKWAHHSQIKLLEEGANGYYFRITLNGINRINERAPFMNIEIAEPEPVFEE